MSWRDGYYAAVKNHLESRGYRPIKDIAEVTQVEYQGSSEYYCTTCGPDPEQVIIHYINTNGDNVSAYEYIDLAEFINSLPD